MTPIHKTTTTTINPFLLSILLLYLVIVLQIYNDITVHGFLLPKSFLLFDPTTTIECCHGCAIASNRCKDNLCELNKRRCKRRRIQIREPSSSLTLFPWKNENEHDKEIPAVTSIEHLDLPPAAPQPQQFNDTNYGQNETNQNNTATDNDSTIKNDTYEEEEECNIVDDNACYEMYSAFNTVLDPTTTISTTTTTRRRRKPYSLSLSPSYNIQYVTHQPFYPQVKKNNGMHSPVSIEHVGLPPPPQPPKDARTNHTIQTGHYAAKTTNYMNNMMTMSSTMTNMFDYNKQQKNQQQQQQGYNNVKLPHMKFWPLKTTTTKTTISTPPPPPASPAVVPPQTMSSSLLLNKNYHPNQTITVADLDILLRQNGYVRFVNLPSSQQQQSNSPYSTSSSSTTTTTIVEDTISNSLSKEKYNQNSVKTYSSSWGSSIYNKNKNNKNVTTSPTATQKERNNNNNNKRVAFPQPSTLSPQNIKIGTILSAAILGCVIGVSLAPNLWLVGFIFGTLYGQDVARDVTDDDDEDEEEDDENDDDEEEEEDDDEEEKEQPPKERSIIAKTLLQTGHKLASLHLTLYDFFHYQWFIYKTGQLSYNYYKQYAALDSKFNIQEKIDAWNAKFQEGKKNFDLWEKEHEVGRKVLAGLRTVWLVEEQSLKKGDKKYRKNQSKYRIIRYTQSSLSFLQKFVTAIYDIITRKKDGPSELTSLLRGIQVSLSELSTEEITQKVGSAIAALVLANLIGVLFAVAPAVLGFLAFGIGVIYPTWLSRTFSEIRNLVDATKDKGRSRKGRRRQEDDGTKKGGRLVTTTTNVNSGYNYFVRKDGTKRWYRTHQPLMESNPLLRWFQAKQSELIEYFDSIGKEGDDKKKDEKKGWFR